MIAEVLGLDDFIKMYIDRQLIIADELKAKLVQQKADYQPTGWMMLECQMLDSSRLGERQILVYGPNNTYKEVPTQPISTRGLASDMSTVVALLLVEEVHDGV